ncbi:MAG: MmgE/PrpD family protein [Coriobacteriia bacterium]|nr:MmgE/PrpD family protein [Coriobacteriia bacterium]
MKFTTDYRLENYITGLTWDNLPETVQARARGCALDLAGALILGSKGKQFQAGLSLARSVFAPGDVPVFGSMQRASLPGAASALGHAANSFDIDDGHNLVKGHPGASFAAGLLAAACQQNCTYRQLLTTLVVGYDVAVRAGKAIQSSYGFLHSTGTYGAVATAAVAGRLMGLTPAQLNTALAIADFHAPLTPVMRAVEYPSMSKDGVPFGALVGCMAVLETLAGSTGKTYTLESEDQAYLLDDLGETFEIMNLYFKPYTCCRWAHQPIRAIINLRKEQGLCAEQVEHVTVHTFDSAARLSKVVPADTDEAQYNIAWPVACALVYGEVGYNQVCDEAVGDPAVISMMDRLDFTVDPELEAQFPEKRLAWVEVLTTDGRTLATPVYAAEGEATDGIDNEWIRAKFLRITAPVFPEQHAVRVADALLEGSLDAHVRDFVESINEVLAPEEDQ